MNRNNNTVQLGSMASKWAPKGPTPTKPQADEPFGVPSYNACLSKYASRELKDYWDIDPETDKKIYI